MRGKRIVTADVRFANEVKAIGSSDHHFVFCDYHSDRYNPAPDHESEKLTQSLLAKGYTNGQVFY